MNDIDSFLPHQRNCLGTVKHPTNTPSTVKHSYWALLVQSCPFAGIPIIRVEVVGGVA